MNFAGLEIPPVLILACISGIVWAIRLEGKFKIQEREVEEIKKHIEKIEVANQEVFKDILSTLREIQKGQHEMNVEVVRVMNEVKHMNTKITRLESGKVLPILHKYFDEEGMEKHNGG